MHRRLGRFVETFRGSSFPTRGETTDGEACVVKMRGAGNGDEAVLSELVVNRIACADGLPVPMAFVVEIEAGFRIRVFTIVLVAHGQQPERP